MRLFIPRAAPTYSLAAVTTGEMRSMANGKQQPTLWPLVSYFPNIHQEQILGVGKGNYCLMSASMAYGCIDKYRLRPMGSCVLRIC